MRSALACLPLIVIGCSSGPQNQAAVAPPVIAAGDPWAITTTDPNATTPALLWNGLIGVRVAPHLLDGPDMGFFDISRYDLEGEEKIQPQPNPVRIVLDQSSNELRPDRATDFSSRLDFRTGIISSQWTDPDTGFKVNGQLAISPGRRILAEKWSVIPTRSASLSLGLGPSGVNETIRMIERESGIEKDSVERVTLSNGTKFRIRTALTSGVSESNAVKGQEWVGQITWSYEPGEIPTFDQVAVASKAEWANRWKTDIEIDGPVEDQQFVRSALFYLRSSIHPAGGMSISPMGLSSEIYGGHVFWDADIWVFPALAFLDPELARAIPNYRLKRSHESSAGTNPKASYAKNMLDWLSDSRPIGNGKLGKPTEAIWHPGSEIKVPWESSVSGKETVPGQSKFQDHVTGSVHFMLGQASALGLVEPANVERFTWGATDFYLQRITKRPDGKFDLKGTMSPDENHIGDNDLYTNLLAQSVIDDGLWKVPAEKRPQLALPRDEKTFLTYDGDALRGYKQAAAVLSIYPLQFKPAELQAAAMMNRFADKVTKNGPAMTDSIHAIIWARLGETERAYATWKESWQPFVKPPFLLFSEKRSSSRTYFTTGAAGSIQAVLFGFAGLRIDRRKRQAASWSISLKNGYVLSASPHLPPAWKSMTLRGLKVLGKRYDLRIEGNRVIRL